MGPEYKCCEGKRNLRREIGRDREKSRGGWVRRKATKKAQGGGSEKTEGGVV